MEAKKVLIVYESWTGATREVADAVARTLQAAGWAADAREAREVQSIAAYDAVVIGNSVHAGKLSPKTIAFGKRFAGELAHKPMAWFLLCLTMAEDTPEHRKAADAYLDQLRAVLPAQPLDVALFGGAVLKGSPDIKKQGLIMRFVANKMAETTPDHRDWAAIDTWAAALAPKLAGAAVPA